MLLENVPTVLAVASGKGGVGKTFVSVELARTIEATGTEVGLLDVDLTTPDSDQAVSEQEYDWDDPVNQSGPPATAASGPESGISERPTRRGGLQVVSKGIDLPDYAVNTNDERMQLESMMWFIRQVQWDDVTTHVIIDTPPGTGTVIQNILRDVNADYGFLVTTGTVNSVRDACRTHELFRRVGLNHAVIANMRYTVPSIDRTKLRERLRDIDKIDDDEADAIVDTVETTVTESRMPLHDDGVDLGERFSAPIVADIPFTEDTDCVREELRTALDRTGLSATLNR